MPSKGEYYNHYVWLMNTLLQAKRITFEEINFRWERDWNYSLPKRTFQQYKIAVQEMFDVVIDCDVHNGYQYYISNIEDFKTDKSRQWLLNTFCASNLIEQSKSIKNKIVFEEIPENSEYLSFLVDAMKRNKKLEIVYLPYETDEPSTYIVHPYCMRLYHQHWYVLGFPETHPGLRHFAVNRMKKLSMKEESFTYPDDFSADTFYRHSIGIYVNNDLPAQKVLLRVNKHLVNYYRSLPIHHSQKEIEKTDEYSIFEYLLCITPDLTHEILSRGSQIEVLEPERLRNEIQERLKETLKMYNK